MDWKSPRARPAKEGVFVGLPSTLLLYPTDSDTFNCTGKSLQFSGSLGNMPPRDGSVPAFDVTSTGLERSSPSAPATPPSIRTAPTVKAPLRFIKPLCSRAHAPVQTPIGAVANPTTGSRWTLSVSALNNSNATFRNSHLLTVQNHRY